MTAPSPPVPRYAPAHPARERPPREPRARDDRDPRARLTATWAGLTSRGGAFLAGGAVILVASLVLRTVDVMRIALLLIALPLAAVAVMASTSLHVTVRREASPRRGRAGAPVTVTVALTNRGSRRTPTLLVEDTVPAALPVTTRVVAPPLPARATARLAYTVVPPRRGRYVLGPARVHAVEAFGLLERTWRAAGSDVLVVRPHVVALADALRPTRRGGESDAARSGVVATGAMDMSVREYHEGDDLRRVHWPTTARRGQLMVRRDERPQESTTAVLIDTRAGALGRAAADGTHRLLEWAVVGAASVAVRVAEEGQAVSLHGDLDLGQDRAGGGGSGGSRDDAVTDAVEEVLDRLAVVAPGPDTRLSEALPVVDGAGATTVVAFLAGVDAVAARLVAGSCRLARRVAFVVSERQQGDDAEPVRLLRAGGWITLPVTPDVSFAEAWPVAVHADLVGGAR